MTDIDRDALGAKLARLERVVLRLGLADQLTSTTIGTEDEPVDVSGALDVAAEAATSIPQLQDDIDEHGEVVSSLAQSIDAAMAELDARLELADANLSLAREEIEEAQAEIDAAFGQQVDGLSENVETAIRASGSALTEAEAASSAARDAAGLAASKGETITQVSAPTGSRATPANLWIDNSPNAAGVPKNQPNRYGPVTVPDPNAVALILPAATATTETEVLRISVAPGATTPVALMLSVSMALNGLVKSSIGRLRDGVTGAVLASYAFSDKGDSTAGNQETWTLPAGFTATPSASVLVLTIQSNNANSPAVYSLHRTITASNWQAITDQKAIDAAASAATAGAAAAAARDIADQANTAAGVAKTAADNANTAALQAAGIANGKGKVIPQASKPTGGNAAAGNLWIRTTDNTPWVYDTSIPDWVQVTDKNATDAAAAAVKAQQDATAATNAAKAAQATADSKPLILFSSTAGPSGTAPTGTIWFLWDQAKNVAGQWLQSGTLAAPVWTPQQIRSEVIANLDVAKLTAGSAAIAELVAQKIAAATGNFQTANVSNLFVTSGATMSQAVIDYLFANVVQAKKITAGMIDVDSLNGITLVGATIKSAASGQRAEIVANQVNFYSEKNALAGNIKGLNFPWAGIDYPTVYVGGGTYGVVIGGGAPIWSGTTVGLRVSGDTAVKRVFLDPAAGSDGYVCGIYGFQRRSGTDSTPVPMPLLYAKGSTSGSAYPEMYLENVTAVSSGDYRRPDGSSLLNTDYLQVSPSAAVPVNGTTDVTSRFNQAVAGGRLTTAAWSASGDGFTVPAGMGGLWQLSLAIRSVAGGQAFVQLNGTYVAFQDGTNATLNALIPLAAGDKVRLFMYSTSSANSAQAATRFTALRLGS